MESLRQAASDPSSVAIGQQFADIMRLLRLVIDQVDANADGIRLTRDSALFHAAFGLLDASPEQRGSTRTALMVLRDLVWRVDSVRAVLRPHDAEPHVAEALGLLDTSDIHLFLKQEP